MKKTILNQYKPTVPLMVITKNMKAEVPGTKIYLQKNIFTRLHHIYAIC